MMKIKCLSIFLFSLMMLASCGGSKTSRQVAFEREIYTPRQASGFSVTAPAEGESVMLSVSSPWQGADSVVSRLLIVRGDEKVPEGFDGQVLHGDARRIVAMSSTHVAMLDALGALDRVAGVSGIDFISNPRVQARRGELADVGYEGNVNFEALLSVEPDLVLLYGVNGASSMEGKLKELGIPFVYIGDYLEDSPLGKAEWIVALAEIAGRRQEGEEAFSGIAGRYEELRKKVADSVLDAPSVMLNVPYGDSWFMPSAESCMARLIRDAGGDYIYKENTGNVSRPIDMEEAYMLASQADMWLNLDRTSSKAELTARYPRFSDVRSVRNGYVYNNTLRANAAGGNDFYESGIVNPDVVLRDLVAIFHPELADGQLFYYKRLE